jgi:2-polyprenyl-3-methyl-5-hydroxy-6-metoxy-1,4-benzoquinol methylase
MNRTIREMNRTNPSINFSRLALSLLEQKNPTCMFAQQPLDSISSHRETRMINALLVDVVQEGASVIHIDCGQGEILFRLASKIRRGVGLDLSEHAIKDALSLKEKGHAGHLYFLRMDGLKITENIPGHFDVGIINLQVDSTPEELLVSQARRLAFKTSKVIVSTSKTVDPRTIDRIFTQAGISLQSSVVAKRNLMKLWIGQTYAFNA